MRTYGAKNADHELKRQRMIGLIAPVVMRAAPLRPSLREMAKAAGVNKVATARRRDGDVFMIFVRICVNR